MTAQKGKVWSSVGAAVLARSQLILAPLPQLPAHGRRRSHQKSGKIAMEASHLLVN